MSVYITDIRGGQRVDAGYVFRVAFGGHDSLGSTDAFHKVNAALGEIFANIGFVVSSVVFIQKMDTGDMGFFAADSHDSAHGTCVGGRHKTGGIFCVQKIGDFV